MFMKIWDRQIGDTYFDTKFQDKKSKKQKNWRQKIRTQES